MQREKYCITQPTENQHFTMTYTQYLASYLIIPSIFVVTCKQLFPLYSMVSALVPEVPRDTPEVRRKRELQDHVQLLSFISYMFSVLESTAKGLYSTVP